MGWLLALGCVIALFVLLGLARLGVHVMYAEGKLKVRAKASFVWLTLVGKDKPKKEKPKKEKTKKTSKKEKPAKEKKQKDDGGLTAGDKLRAYFDCAEEVSRRLDRRFKLNRLTVHFRAASEDPFSAAVTYGAACAAAGNIIPVIEKHFRIGEYDIRTDVSFTEEKPYVYLDAVLTVAVWELVWIALGAVKHLPRKKRKRKSKGAKNNGKEAHK